MREVVVGEGGWADGLGSGPSQNWEAELGSH